MPRLGARKLFSLILPKIKEAGIKIGRDKFIEFLRLHDLLVKPKKNYTKTTMSKHWLHKHPNLLKEKIVKQIEEVFVSDITYVKSQEGTHYLSLVTDAYSRKIMGFHLSHDMPAKEVVKALKMAGKNKITTTETIHHSDRGLQYCSDEYQSELEKLGMKASMTDGYDCYQNALAERINGILKDEFLLSECQTFKELEKNIEQSIIIYNQMRPHLSLDYRTPESVHKKASYV